MLCRPLNLCNVKLSYRIVSYRIRFIWLRITQKLQLDLDKTRQRQTAARYCFSLEMVNLDSAAPNNGSNRRWVGDFAPRFHQTATLQHAC